MAKRGATSDLNHDNWDRQDEPEDAGTFSKASDDALKKRVIKVAKRRNPISSASNEESKSAAFSSFSGFGGGQQLSATASTNSFSFLNNLTNKTEAPKTNGTPEKVNQDMTDKKLDEYYAKLKGLNEGVTEWIRKHVSANPFINLQPVFKDYDSYIVELEKLKNEASNKSDKNADAAPKTATSQFSFGSTSSSPPKFSFGATSTGFSFASSATTSSFNSQASTATLSSSDSKPFSFGVPTSDSGKFSFTSTMVKPADNPKPQEQTDEDEPPKVEFKQVVEEGHVYTTRCKVFLKKNDAFADHGVGTLYLKPVAGKEKVQLIVRADTSLGNLLCNFILSESIPTKRMGKKDVMLVCVPTPDAEPKPIPVLLRVKSPEAADELLETLDKHKK